MEEPGIIRYIGNQVIGFTLERYIGNPVMFLVSCILVLRPWPTIFWFHTATISWIYAGHHILDLHPWATTSYLILFLPCPILHAALMWERPRSLTYMTCQQGAHVEWSHTHNYHRNTCQEIPKSHSHLVYI